MMKNGTVIDTTENHPFYVEGKGWCAAAELEDGDVLRTQDGKTEIVEDVQIKQLSEAAKVYNLEIGDSHTYYVSADEVLVHNACGNDDVFEMDPKDINFSQSSVNRNLTLHTVKFRSKRHCVRVLNRLQAFRRSQ